MPPHSFWGGEWGELLLHPTLALSPSCVPGKVGRKSKMIGDVSVAMDSTPQLATRSTYRGADKSLARPGRKQATAENSNFSKPQKKKKKKKKK